MNSVKIALLGDIMPGGLLHYKADPFIKSDVLDYLKGFDFRLGTLECAVGDDLDYYRGFLDGKMKNKNIIYVNNNDLYKIKEIGIDMVTLANNHIFDLGIKGFENTLAQLQARNIKYFGAGFNLKQASAPAIIERNGKSIAFIACCEIFDSSPYPATKNSPGYNPLDIDHIVNEIKKAKALHEYVYVLPHWGDEFTYFPTYKCKKNAFQMVEAGADGVFGSHPHVIQPIIYYKNKPIVFSLGNFLFPDRYVMPPAPTYYPDNPSELKNVVTSRSPYCDNITLKVWNSRAREGMVCGLNINNNQSLTINPTKLIDDTVNFNKIKYFDKIILQFAKLPLKYFYKSFCKLRKVKKTLFNNI